MSRLIDMVGRILIWVGGLGVYVAIWIVIAMGVYQGEIFEAILASCVMLFFTGIGIRTIYNDYN